MWQLFFWLDWWNIQCQNDFREPLIQGSDSNFLKYAVLHHIEIYLAPHRSIKSQISTVKFQYDKGYYFMSRLADYVLLQMHGILRRGHFPTPGEILCQWLDSDSHHYIRGLDNIEVSFEVDDMIMHAGGHCIPS